MGRRKKKNTQRKLFLHCYNEDHKKYSHTPRSKHYYGAFYTLDPRTRQIVESPHTIVSDSLYCAMVALGSDIYLVGKTKSSYSINDDDDNEKPPPPPSCVDCREQKLLFHEGLSCLDVNGGGWKAAPVIECNETRPNCVAFGGKIYLFKESGGGCFAEVFNPTLNKWYQLATKLPTGFGEGTDGEYFRIADPVIADPLNKRILMHWITWDESSRTWNRSSPVYAYYPPPDDDVGAGKWECIIPHFSGWNGEKTMLLLDNVLYMHVPGNKDLIFAFDLVKKEWLRLVWTSHFSYDHVDIDGDSFGGISLHHLGDGFICLAKARLCRYDDGRKNTAIRLINFRVSRRTIARLPGQIAASDSIIIITPISYDSYYLDSVSRLVNVVAI